MSTNPADELLSRREAALLLGVEVNTLARWLCYGRGNNGDDRGPSCVRGEGGRIFYRRGDVLAWAEARDLRLSSGLSARPAPRPSSVGRRSARRYPPTRTNSPPQAAPWHQPPPQVAPWPAATPQAAQGYQAPWAQSAPLWPQAAPWHQPPTPQAAPWPAATPQAAQGYQAPWAQSAPLWPQASQAASWHQPPIPQAASASSSLELGRSQAELDQSRAELGRVRAELADAERRCTVEHILLCYLARMLSKTQSGFGRPVLVDFTNVIENANVVSREYMIIDHHKSKLWKVECPECGDFASQELPHSKLTGLNPCECGARLLVVETSPWFESPVERANATPTVSVLSLKSSKQGAK